MTFLYINKTNLMTSRNAKKNFEILILLTLTWVCHTCCQKMIDDSFIFKDKYNLLGSLLVTILSIITSILSKKKFMILMVSKLQCAFGVFFFTFFLFSFSSQIKMRRGERKKNLTVIILKKCCFFKKKILSVPLHWLYACGLVQISAWHNMFV